jgi:hypothetical protein
MGNYIRKHNELIIGSKFGRLTIISYEGDSNWLCKCDCGIQKEIKYSSLKRGDTRSCGCYRKEQTAINNTTHGMKDTKIYSVWMSMKDRCYRPGMSNYKYYGGRGIKMCKRWIKFENFKNDMYESYLEHIKYNKNTRLDRINNNGDYCKKNCQWLTHKENCNKTRQCHYITYNGETRTISEWSECLFINYDKLERRLNKFKWPVEKAFNKK